MSKISLVTRRKDKYFDCPTAASQRAQKRLSEEQQQQAKDADEPEHPSEQDISVSIEEGAPTVDVTLPSDRRIDFEQLAAEYLQGKDKANIMAVIEKEKIGEKWGLKLQFLPEQPTKMLTAKQLAQMFGVGTHTIYHLLKTGVIQGYKIGKAWRFNWSEVIQALGKNKGGS
jgi:excisionase family DNA binding protein